MGESVTLEGYEVLQTWSILEDGSSADPIVNDRKLGYDRTEGERKKNEETTIHAEYFHQPDNYVSRANGLCRFQW